MLDLIFERKRTFILLEISISIKVLAIKELPIPDSSIQKQSQEGLWRILARPFNLHTDRPLIGQDFENYFTDIFTSISPSLSPHSQRIIVKKVISDLNQKQEATPSRGEVRQTIFHMGNFKSSRLDGMTTTFYNYYQGIVSP